MPITKREFAVKLLFWLLPWPISKALPRALRIYYFGPGGEPPSGWYDFWGIPIWFEPDPPPLDDFIEDPPVDPPPWWPPDAPPLDDFIEDPPVDPPPWWPVDPINPPPPDQFPDLPDGPVNPGDPYTPGPGPNGGSNPNWRGEPLTEVTVDCEDAALRNYRIRARGADGDTWLEARAAPAIIDFMDDEPFHEEMVGFDYDGVNDRWYENRTFFLFDLTGLPAGKTIYSVSLLLLGKRYNALKVSVQESTQANSVTAPTWDGFTGETFKYLDWIIDTDNILDFNRAGRNYIESVLGAWAKLMVRDYTYDYLGVSPSESTKFSGAYSVEGPAAWTPRLLINYY